MTDQDYVHYLFIVDRSGSMQSIKKDTEGGIRAFVGQQLEGAGGSRRTVSFYQFDTIHDCVYDFELLEKAETYSLMPRGGTALLDACGFAISQVGTKLARMPGKKRPGQVMVVIATDGEENSSREYTRAQVKEMIQHQQDKYGWKFTYVGANQDAFSEAGSIGIGWQGVLNYAPTARGTSSAWLTASAGVSMSTAPSSGNIFYSPQQRDEAMGK